MYCFNLVILSFRFYMQFKDIMSLKRGFQTSDGQLTMASGHGNTASSASLNRDVTSNEAL